jgi:vitamin B12 transporter
MVFNLSNSFRKPSFNENYWQPGGNPDLKNESGIYSDLIWKQKILNSRGLVLNVSQTFYYSNINDLIQWSPVNGVWTPENLNQVKTRGVDLNLNMDYAKTYLDLSSNLIYLFTSSEMMGESFNHQMGYVPVHSAKLNLDFKYKKFSFGNTLRYTGSRYTTADNNPEYILDPYFLMNMYVGFEFKFKSICLPIVLKCMNVTNTNYEDIRAFPAPGRTFFLNVLIQFIK